MEFALLVTAGPVTHQAAHSAYQFAKAALNKGHRISTIFFYQDGVYNGTRLSAPPQDEPQMMERWQNLTKTHEVELVLCVASAIRRGILDADEAKRQHKDSDNIAEPFKIAGLGVWIEATLAADRVLVFGA